MAAFVKIASELYKKRIIWDRYKNIYNVSSLIAKYQYPYRYFFSILSCFNPILSCFNPILSCFNPILSCFNPIKACLHTVLSSVNSLSFRVLILSGFSFHRFFFVILLCNSNFVSK